MIKTRMLLVTYALVFAVALCLTVPVRAAIIDTNVLVGMTIGVKEPPFADEVTDEDTGPTYASVDITLDHPTSLDQITAWSEINIDPLTAEAANVFFDIGWDCLDWPESYHAGELKGTSNSAQITYDAVVDTTLTYTWDFDYFGYMPFGMGTVKILANGTEIFDEGSVSGTGGPYFGNTTFDMLAGNQYIFEMILSPFVATNAIETVQGRLTGDVSFDFAAVPEPATILLFSSGLIGLAGFRRRFRKN